MNTITRCGLFVLAMGLAFWACDDSTSSASFDDGDVVETSSSEKVAPKSSSEAKEPSSSEKSDEKSSSSAKMHAKASSSSAEKETKASSSEAKSRSSSGKAETVSSSEEQSGKPLSSSEKTEARSSSSAEPTPASAESSSTDPVEEPDELAEVNEYGYAISEKCSNDEVYAVTLGDFNRDEVKLRNGYLLDDGNGHYQVFLPRASDYCDVKAKVSMKRKDDALYIEYVFDENAVMSKCRCYKDHWFDIDAENADIKFVEFEGVVFEIVE